MRAPAARRPEAHPARTRSDIANSAEHKSRERERSGAGAVRAPALNCANEERGGNPAVQPK